FLRQLQWAAEIYEYERNITRAARKLQSRILAAQNKPVNIRTCKARIYSAITYFNVDNSVAVRVWETDYANKYEDLARIAVAADEYKTAKACFDAARECRLRASEAADKESLWAPVFLISNDITLEQLGMHKRSLKEIARKSNEGFYINLIESLPVEREEKQRLLKDANIEDAQIIEETPDDE
ncbi:MAG: hypothetical protein LBS88_06950, partial [Tannerellaceae bacterium]|nr:hypothetical protein [Tannerellaceae bacterium]